MGTCVHFSRSLPSNSWWQTMAGWQVLSRPSAAEGGGRRPAFTGLATQPYSATEVDGWQHKLSRVSQNRAAVQPEDTPDTDVSWMSTLKAGRDTTCALTCEDSTRLAMIPAILSALAKCLRKNEYITPFSPKFANS